MPRRPTHSAVQSVIGHSKLRTELKLNMLFVQIFQYFTFLQIQHFTSFCPQQYTCQVPIRSNERFSKYLEDILTDRKKERKTEILCFIFQISFYNIHSEKFQNIISVPHSYYPSELTKYSICVCQL